MLYDVSVLEGIVKLPDILPEAGRPISYYPAVAKACGGPNATILLCQLVYWTGKQSDPNGWIYKTRDELADELGLSLQELRTARRKLIERGLILQRPDPLNHRVLFKIDSRRIAQLDLEPVLIQHGPGVESTVGACEINTPIIGTETTSEKTKHKLRLTDGPLAENHGSRLDDFREGFALLKKEAESIRKRA